MSSRIGFALISALLILPGCGEGEAQTAVHPVSGTVVNDGKPVARATVRFHPVKPPAGARPEDPATAIRVADTDDEGKFALSTYMSDDGAPVGDYVVTVLPYTPSVEDFEGKVAPTPKRAPYTNPDTTTLKATVQPGDNRFEFELD